MNQLLIALALFCMPSILLAQENIFFVKDMPSQKKVVIKLNGKPFTELIYTDTMEKPFLYPIYATNGAAITRGFPLNPKPNDPTDHPHHIGLWFNYESVNGLDFWNNSYAIDADKKKNYGWIRTQKILQTKGGKQATVAYTANWTDQQRKVLLEEKTVLNFSTIENDPVIEHITKLTALEDIHFNDVKDGMLGLRVAHELELPIAETKKYTDASGIVTYVKSNKDSSVTGNYLTSEGKQGEAAWGTRAAWCMLYGKLGGDSISIVMIDHPKNPGYPTYWHARNYGLFAANPLGQKVFSNGKTSLNFKLPKGESVIFKYKIIIAAGKNRLPNAAIEKLAQDFSSVK
ncbi:MAG: PmoA family protein [Chitinophagaceae bacterium]|nr:PmoA family protein [Chitinophagaceae bacterium]